jgi:apolipoprotein D and lipocalin family protein
MSTIRSIRRPALLFAGAAVGLLLAACASPPPGKEALPLALAKQVDLKRFMGDWYVIGSIGTAFERGAHNAKENYVLDDNGTVDTTFSYQADSFEGPQRIYSSRGYIQSPSNAVWGQQYIWPIKADYRISFVSPDYQTTVVTRQKRDYVWIMARTPSIPEAEYQRLVKIASDQGYDKGQIRRVPQQPLAVQQAKQ